MGIFKIFLENSSLLANSFNKIRISTPISNFYGFYEISYYYFCFQKLPYFFIIIINKYIM